MYHDLEPLTRLLRVELTAVHQQFFHMLALRQWKYEEAYLRVTGIDKEDFQNAMQIIDHLVSEKQPIELPAHRFFPGSDLPSLLHAEHHMEMCITEVLGRIDVVGSEALAKVDRAAAPRPDYQFWLNGQIAGLDTEGKLHRTNVSMAEFTAAMMALIEQSMLHAFYYWHANRLTEADNFWRISGAAMLYGTALVRRGALMDALPTPGTIVSVEMQEDLQDAFHSDRHLVQQCARLARAAANDEKDEATRRICLRIADDCSLIENMKIDGDFPAIFGRSKVFESFAATRERHLS